MMRTIGMIRGLFTQNLAGDDNRISQGARHVEHEEIVKTFRTDHLKTKQQFIECSENHSTKLQYRNNEPFVIDEDCMQLPGCG